MTIVNDGVPRFSEYFTITLTSAVSSDGISGPTPTSGAVINTATASQTLTILDYNYPNGLLQFTTLTLAQLHNMSRVLPAAVSPNV